MNISAVIKAAKDLVDLVRASLELVDQINEGINEELVEIPPPKSLGDFKEGDVVWVKGQVVANPCASLGNIVDPDNELRVDFGHGKLYLNAQTEARQ